MEWLIYLMLFVTIISLSGIGLGYVEGRRQHQLEMQREERRLVEARTKEIEAKNRQAAAEYRSALAELERFDSRKGELTPPDHPTLKSGSDPTPPRGPLPDHQ